MLIQRKRALFAAAIICATGALSACGGSGGSSSNGGLGAASFPANSKTFVGSDLHVQTAGMFLGDPSTTSGCSVSMFGDSILRGGYPLNNLPATLPETPAAGVHRMRPAYTVVDNAGDGDFALRKLQSFLNSSLDTRFVVIEYGMNDAGNGLAYEAPLRSMVRRVTAAGRKPIVTGLSHVVDEVPNRDAYDAVARRVAAEEGALFADWDSVPFDKSQMMDGVHPSQPYSTRLAERIVEVLDKAAPECAQ
ncbi:SGNH/GDSL hydrolase family protein [Variovorax sp. 770b2]|uniref:SGNH/GDSL hydrolase family protein n=1 Tax=Variovorax sp. 770b2 TaxID=1566271 RepID=UPI0008EFAF76|nr:SGNH/GDSL hydrolase family protein [Variovorax sp. 770b2]SFQ43148.1 Lysophospholipase L1 [Variovorax sp. 770b2]